MIYDEEHYNQVLAVARSYRNDVERLEKQLAITEKALELCERHHIGFEESTVKEQVDWRETRIKENIDYFKNKAKEMLENE